MRNTISVSIFLFVLFWGCVKAPGPNGPKKNIPEPLTFEKINFQIGQKWSYKRLYINTVRSGPNQPWWPDTLTHYINAEAVQDTFIDGDKYVVIEADHIEPGEFEVFTYKIREAYHFGEDTVKTYQFKGSTGFPHSLLKTKAQKPGSPIWETQKPSDIRKHLLRKKFKSATFDTSVFYDLTFPLVFPLVKDSSWYFRPQGSPAGHLPLRKTFLGMDSVTVPAGTFNAHYFRWELTEMWPSFSEIQGWDWVGPTGLFRRFYDFGESDWTDEVGRILGTFSSFDDFQYLGSTHISTDSMVPRHEITQADRDFADQHFDPARFLAFHGFILQDSYSSDTGIPLVFWDRDPFVHAEYFKEQYQKKSTDYYVMIGRYDEFSQGWNDVNPDMVSNNHQWIFSQTGLPQEWAHRFRGFAIESVGLDSLGVPSDTTWLHYHDPTTKTRPYYFGFSANQKKFSEMLFD